MTDMDKMMIEPIPMLLYCPQCGQQHVDERDERTPDWTNPPHRSHLCHDCGCIWRPADVPTNGVAAIETQGKADTWTAARGNAETATAYNPDDRLREALDRAVNALHYIYETSDDEHAARKAKAAHDEALPFTTNPADAQPLSGE